MKNGRQVSTYIAVDGYLDIRVVSPHYSVNTVSQIVEEEPDAEEGNSKIPGLTNETMRKNEEHEESRDNAEGGVERVSGIDSHCADVNQDRGRSGQPFI